MVRRSICVLAWMGAVSGCSGGSHEAIAGSGAMGGAHGLAIHPTDERQLLLGLTYGLALSRDGGASWTWMGEEQNEGNGGDVDPSIVMTSDGRLVVLSRTRRAAARLRDCERAC